MATGKIIVEIDEEGIPTIHVQGIKGQGCLAATKALEDALGQTTSRQTTKEYHERAQAAAKQVQRA